RAMVLGLVDDFLRMFDAYAERKGFGLHEPPLPVEQFENIPRGMPRGQDDMTGRKVFAGSQFHAGDGAVFLVDVGYPTVESDFTAVVQYRLAHTLDDTR